MYSQPYIQPTSFSDFINHKVVTVYKPIHKVITGETLDQYYDRQFNNIENLPDLTDNAVDNCQYSI